MTARVDESRIDGAGTTHEPGHGVMVGNIYRDGLITCPDVLWRI